MHRIAGLELGGTKCLALLAEGTRIVDRVRVPTTTPHETLALLEQALARWWTVRPFAALGIGSFGPLGLDPARTDHGRITTTPKPGWADTDILGHFTDRYAVPIGFDTDVTGAALAEHLWGDARGLDVNVYVTVGTGIGGGAIVNGKPLRGLLHPEIGHIRVARSPDDTFPGICPTHGDCLEGIASGPAIAARIGRPGTEPAADDPALRHVAHALGQLCATLILTLSPQRIAFGGGVIGGQPPLLGMIRAATLASLNGYVAPVDFERLATLIAPASFGEDAGPLGAIALGHVAL